jgi:carbamate kinase
VNPGPGTIVVAVGGNALAPPGERVTIYEQFDHTRTSLEVVVDLVRHGWKVAIVHGNGPQVGNALARNELAMDVVEPLPLGVLVAGTAGWIGYMIQQSLQNAFRRAGITQEVLTVVTQTEVDPNDPQLSDATKPIGSILTPERADRLRAVGVPLTPDRGAGIRRLAPSPEPIDVVEADAVRHLLEEGKVVVAAGGGGTPVYRTAGGTLEGVDAVVDKDRTAAILGCRIGASTLLILTNVDAVYRDWGTERARPERRLSLAQAVELHDGEALGEGSMAPKLEAAIHFLRDGGQRAVIAALEDGMAALSGRAGTTITGESE